MAMKTTKDLSTLLKHVAAAPPSERMHFRDEVATHGTLALDQLEPWLANARLATFAVRTIGRIGDSDHRARATTILTAALPATRADLGEDIQEIFLRWGVKVAPSGAKRRTRLARRTPDLASA